MAATEAKNENDEAQQETTDPKPLPYPFEKELVQNQARHFWIMDEFIPVAVGRKVLPLERKFHAWHEQQLPTNYNKRMRRYTELDRRTTQLGLPRLESQVYGWLPQERKHGDEILRQLNFIRAPKLRCDMTIYGECLISERISERPPFNGLRFFLR